MLLDNLPGELFDAILDQLPSSDSQYTAYSLILAIPDAPIRITHLYRCIHLTQPTQPVKFYKHLRLLKTLKLGGDQNEEGRPVLLRNVEVLNPLDWINELSVESWTVDPDIIVNIIQMLPHLRSLNLWIGPSNFSPEHLEDLFSKPMKNLWYLGLRFRPYVQRANYYQFLKGAYFDSALTRLSRWPSSNINVLSLVQDPITQDMMPPEQRSFAQPLVFFKLELCLATLISSSAAASLSHLEVRIPSRPITRALCNPPVQTPHPNSNNKPLLPPDIHYLDISTCAVLETEIDTILVRYPSIQHIVLDKCEPATGDLALEGRWNAFGKRCALIGVKRAKEREKLLKLWYDTIPATGGPAVSPSAIPHSRSPKAKKGRKGLATPTISLRERELPVMRGALMASAAEGTNSKSEERQKIRILPCLPTLRSISVTYSYARRGDEKLANMRKEFESGWAEGIAQLSVTRGMRRTSANNGVRVMRIKKRAELNSEDDNEEYYAPGEGMLDLEEVDASDAEAFGLLDTERGSGCYDAPVLCFMGTGTNLSDHPWACPHRTGNTMMLNSTT